jgi:hypothetical protein
MPPPGVLLDLALTLHPGHRPDEQEHAAMLAARLGYIEVWLAIGSAGGPDADWPDAGRLEALTAAARPARVGLVLPDEVEEAETGLLALPPPPPGGGPAGGPLLEASGPSEGLLRAVGGPAAWRDRVRLPAFDAAAAGTVIRPISRTETVSAVAAAARARSAAGLVADRHPIVVALPVSIGRTLNEAVARALRDPRFAGSGHPREVGLFGTHEQAQGQVLDLAGAGADALRVTLAEEIDVADLLAQVRSLVVGATPVLHSRRD